MRETIMDNLQLTPFLIETISASTDEAKRKHFRQKISEYMDRAEKLKQHVEQEKEGIYSSIFSRACTYPFICLTSINNVQLAIPPPLLVINCERYLSCALE